MILIDSGIKYIKNIYCTKLFSRNAVLSKYIKNWDLYLILLFPVTYIIVFKYIPMYGAQIAFKDYIVTKGIMESPWVGLKHFKQFIETPNFVLLIRNTLGISIYQLAIGFPFPILLALSLNYCNNRHFKKLVQMTTYAPYFISVVVLCGIIVQFLSPRYGIVNQIIQLFGGDKVNFLGKPQVFKSIYVWSSVWQTSGWNSIIYMATLAGIDPELHEAAIMDGASKLKRCWSIDIPGIMPTAAILLILNLGNIMNLGFEKAFLLQNPLNLESSEIIQTYVYKMGIVSDVPQYSYSAAIGLFNSIINFILLILVNNIARKTSNSGLW